MNVNPDQRQAMGRDPVVIDRRGARVGVRRLGLRAARTAAGRAAPTLRRLADWGDPPADPTRRQPSFEAHGAFNVGCTGWYLGPGVQRVTYPPAMSLAPAALEAVMRDTGPLIPRTAFVPRLTVVPDP